MTGTAIVQKTEKAQGRHRRVYTDAEEETGRMAEKELRRMSRTELIEIIYALKNDADRLEKENENLKEQLEKREIRISEAGSIAEAAIKLNRVFEAAQTAADDYLDSIKKEREQAEFLKEEAWKTFEKAQKDAKSLQDKAEKESRDILNQAKKKADEILKESGGTV